MTEDKPYTTLEQLAAWLFEHQASISVEPGIFPGSRVIRAEIKEPAHYVFEQPVAEEHLKHSSIDVRTMAMLIAWKNLDQQVGH